MKITTVPEREMAAVSLRSACDISRACRPGSESPISPSSSALGTSTETARPRGNDPAPLARTAGAEPHDSALTELPLDLGDREVESLSPVALPFRHRVLPSENVLRAF